MIDSKLKLQAFSSVQPKFSAVQVRTGDTSFDMRSKLLIYIIEGCFTSKSRLLSIKCKLISCRQLPSISEVKESFPHTAKLAWELFMYEEPTTKPVSVVATI